MNKGRIATLPATERDVRLSMMRSTLRTHAQACQDVEELIAAQQPELVELRRELHQHPELSGTEFQTTIRLAEYLRRHGVPVELHSQQRGFSIDICDRHASADSPMVGLRGDIDAVGIQDCKTVSYHSRNAGATHACGHDVHSSALCGAVVALHRLAERDQMPHGFRARAVFQPAEENATGAAEMIERGVLQGVEAIFAMHVDPSRQLGQVGLKSGVNSAFCDELHVRVQGRGGHAARPFETLDPVAAAAQFITTAYGVIPRAVDNREALVLTFAAIHGGITPNVIPDEVTILGTMRSLEKNSRDAAIQRLHAVADAIGAATGTKIDFKITVHCPAVDCDQALVEIAWNACERVVGADGLQRIPKPSMGGEDFAFYLQHVPGVMARIGCSDPAGKPHPLHSSHFDLHEGVIEIGSKYLALAALHWHANQQNRYAH